jgi:hypothetical protein
MTQLKATTALHCKGKEPLRPELVGLAKSAEGSITVFLFSRKSAIGPDDKDVEFQTHFGPLATMLSPLGLPLLVLLLLRSRLHYRRGKVSWKNRTYRPATEAPGVRQYKGQAAVERR